MDISIGEQLGIVLFGINVSLKSTKCFYGQLVGYNYYGTGSNNYYVSSSGNVGSHMTPDYSVLGESVPSSEYFSQSLVDKLGLTWKYNNNSSINNGFPIFNWESVDKF